MKKIRVIYTSQAAKHFSQRDLLDLLHDCRAYNSLDSIYGFLYYKDNIFFQVLEGETKSVEGLLDRIEKDPRHFNLKIYFKKSVENYLFSNWSMGCIEFNNPRLSLIPSLKGELESKENIERIINNLPEITSLLISNPELNFQ